ncbi:MAG: PhnD/SsuA/transferrin family substrate-binding protein [Deltaproteobacteria bacterium]|nr:PhnD/SsuA/transferrin family substrate-binding protein [Deltaproteobacteria bacterium]
MRWEGRQLGRYEVISYLGRGGMGDVLLARVRGEAGFEKEVVLKTLPEGFSIDSPLGEALVREARLGERFEHPGIVQVLDFGRDGDTHFLVMEFVRGFSLRVLLRQARQASRPLPAWVAAHVMREVLGALAYVHELKDADGKLAGLVHRDVSPDNVLLSLTGGVKLSDFGVAKIRSAGAATQPGILRGKYAYMAPESITKGIVDARFDVWSAGVVLYEMLTLERPFSGEDDATLVHSLLRGEHRPIVDASPGVDPALARVVDKALERDPESRWQSARAFRASLDESCPPASDGDLRFAGFLGQILTEPGFAPLAALQTTPSGARAPFDPRSSSHASACDAVQTVTIGGRNAGVARPRARLWPLWAAAGLGALVLGGALWRSGWPVESRRSRAARAPTDAVARKAALRWGTTAALGDDAARSNAEAVAGYLALRLGRRVTPHVAVDYGALGIELGDGRVDAAWLPPLAFVEVEPRGVKALLVSERAGRPIYQSAIIVHRDAPYRRLDDLRGARAAWVDHNSAGGYLFARALLRRSGLDGELAEQRFLGSHASVCRAVADREVDVGATFGVRGDAGTTVLAPCGDLAERARSIRVLDWSAPIPGDTIAVRPGLDAATTALLESAFVQMSREMLSSVFHADGFVAADPSFYEGARALVGTGTGTGE